jgi:hypothetical protein
MLPEGNNNQELREPTLKNQKTWRTPSFRGGHDESVFFFDGTTPIAPTIMTSANNTLTGSGLNQVVTGMINTNDAGTGSGDANGTISFGANVIKSFTFVYGSGATAPADPTTQGIALHDITFTPVPEINPGWMAVTSCLVAANVMLRHRAKFTK